MTAIRILIVDDHFMVRLGLGGSLAQEADLQIVGEAANAADAVAQYAKLKPDVTLMDGQLPDRHGVEAVEEIIAQDANARIVLLSVDETEEDIHRAISAGAKSYLPKSVSRDELLLAIRSVAAGKTYFPHEVAQHLAQRESRPCLTRRELQVLQLVAQGKANKQIASELKLAEVTVKVHVSSILEKLDAPDRTRATTLAVERGIVKF